MCGASGKRFCDFNSLEKEIVNSNVSRCEFHSSTDYLIISTNIPKMWKTCKFKFDVVEVAKLVRVSSKITNLTNFVIISLPRTSDFLLTWKCFLFMSPRFHHHSESRLFSMISVHCDLNIKRYIIVDMWRLRRHWTELKEEEKAKNVLHIVIWLGSSWTAADTGS